jgi:hypothetical protein
MSTSQNKITLCVVNGVFGDEDSAEGGKIFPLLAVVFEKDGNAERFIIDFFTPMIVPIVICNGGWYYFDTETGVRVPLRIKDLDDGYTVLIDRHIIENAKTDNVLGYFDADTNNISKIVGHPFYTLDSKECNVRDDAISFCSDTAKVIDKGVFPRCIPYRVLCSAMTPPNLHALHSVKGEGCEFGFYNVGHHKANVVATMVFDFGSGKVVEFSFATFCKIKIEGLLKKGTQDGYRFQRECLAHLNLMDIGRSNDVVRTSVTAYDKAIRSVFMQFNPDFVHKGTGTAFSRPLRDADSAAVTLEYMRYVGIIDDIKYNK